MELKAPYGLVLESLAKPEANVPFVMPRRIAEAPPDKKIDDPTGSGPFILKQENWRPGEKVVYLRNPAYKPRPEPASGTAGGKVVKVDRVEWIIIKDPQTQAIALATGEVDMITNPSFEQYAAFKTSPDIQLLDATAYNAQYTLIFNHRQPPFDNPKVRRAAMAALNQPAFLQTQVGVPGTYRVCFSVYPCSTPYATSKGMDLLANPSLERAQQLLKESGYHGEAVVVLHPTDFAIIAKLPVVASQLLRQAGFRVDMQSMDWSTLQARRSRLEGWNVFLTAWTEAGLLDPVTANVLSGACHPQAWFGWPCDSELEKLRHAFAVAEGENERKAIAEQVQVRAMEIASYVPLGEYRLVPVARRNVKGVVPGFQLVLWNLEKE